MKNKILTVAAVVLLIVSMTSLLLAGGYQVNEHNARAMGMGGAFVAIASDASAVFFNPAGLAFQKGFSVLGGGTFIMPSTTYAGVTGTTGAGTGSRPDAAMKSQTFFPPNLYIAYNMDNLTFGLGVFAPYGLGTEWEPTWDGRYSAVKTDLQAVYINPSVGYRIDDQWSVGLGLSYITGSAKLNKKVRTLTPTFTPSTSDGEVNLDGTGSGFTFNLGVMYKPTENLSFGLAYRHVAKIKYEGDAKFTNMQGLANYFPGGTGSVELPMPTNIQAGVAYKVMDNLTLSADLQFVQWDAYDKLTIGLPDGPNAPPALGGKPLQTSQVQVKNWTNSFIYRIGGEYAMDLLTLRAGVLYDGTPQITPSVEPMLPDANRIEVTVGIGYRVSEMVSVDVAYQFISAADRKGSFADTFGTNTFATYSGTYQTNANLLGFNIGLHF